MIRETLGDSAANAPEWLFRGAALAAVVGLGIALMVQLDRPTARLAIVTVVLVAGCAAVVAYFALGWDTYVPRRTGARRVLALLPTIVPVVLAVLVSRRDRRVRMGFVSVWIGVAAVVAVSSWSLLPRWRAAQPSTAGLAALRSLELHPGDTVLTNGYSEGFVPAVLDGASGLLDGRAPYTDGPLLARANRLLGDAMAFFAEPMVRREILTRYEVDYVLVSPTPRAIGFGHPFAVAPDQLSTLSELRMVRQSPSFTLYRVVDGDDAG
jgi:hypothetical protein